MTRVDTDLDQILRTAADYLSNSQEQLLTLAEQIRLYLDTSRSPDAATGSNGQRGTPTALVSYLQQQVDFLTEHGRSLSRQLQGYTPSTPLPVYPLSRIQMLQRQEEERARTARDLEESTAQLLANAIFELAAVKHLITTDAEIERMMAGITALQQELEQGLADLRFYIAELEPSSTLGSFGLIAGLRRYLEKYSEQTGIKAALEVQTLLEPLPDTIEVAIFRIIQETLQNIAQHAQASEARVIVSEAGDRLRFSIQDNGGGLNPAAIDGRQRRLGLMHMKDLTELLEGELQIRSDPQTGTQVTLTIPFPQV